MLVTNNKEIFDKCLVLRDHGRSNCGKMFWNDQVGYKYKMSSMQAALGLGQLERIEELVARKQQIFKWYAEGLAGVSQLKLNWQESAVKNTYWMVTVIIEDTLGREKEEIIRLLADKQISSRPFFYPLSSLPAYETLPGIVDTRKRNINAYSISPYGVNLPSGLDMTQAKVQCVIDEFLDILGLSNTKGSE